MYSTLPLVVITLKPADSSTNHQALTRTPTPSPPSLSPSLPPSLPPPGGPTVLLNTQGRDCTALFEAFHPFTDRPSIILSKMKEVRA
jgi:hypothetical protein